MTYGNFREEFPNFAPATLPDIPAEWKDRSWHNDLCPSWNTGRGVIVYVDFRDPDQRELDGPRFMVTGDFEGCGHNEPLIETDDWQAVLAFVANPDTRPARFIAVDAESDVILITSLDSIAAEFRHQAQCATKLAKASKRKGERSELELKARIWRDAAAHVAKCRPARNFVP